VLNGCGPQLKKCQFGRYFVITFKAKRFLLASKESIYNSPFTSSVNWCHLSQEVITTPSRLTGSGDAGFGKRSESLAKPELKATPEIHIEKVVIHTCRMLY